MGFTMLSRFIAICLMITIPAFAADECDPQAIDQSVVKDLQQVSSRMNVECPTPVNVANLCMAVGEKYSERNPSLGTKYAYQNQIYRASCVEAGDSEDIIRAKVQHFWNRFHSELSCSPLGFSVRNGHLLKLAVERNSEDFVEEAILDWKVSLNHVDQTDQRTVLDYIDAEVKKASGTTRERILKRYFDLFRENGAKFKREL